MGEIHSLRAQLASEFTVDRMAEVRDHIADWRLFLFGLGQAFENAYQSHCEVVAKIQDSEALRVGLAVTAVGSALYMCGAAPLGFLVAQSLSGIHNNVGRTIAVDSYFRVAFTAKGEFETGLSRKLKDWLFTQAVDVDTQKMKVRMEGRVNKIEHIFNGAIAEMGDLHHTNTVLIRWLRKAYAQTGTTGAYLVEYARLMALDEFRRRKEYLLKLVHFPADLRRYLGSKGGFDGLALELEKFIWARYLTENKKRATEKNKPAPKPARMVRIRLHQLGVINQHSRVPKWARWGQPKFGVGANSGNDYKGQPIRSMGSWSMSAEDVDYLYQWAADTEKELEIVFNGLVERTKAGNYKGGNRPLRAPLRDADRQLDGMNQYRFRRQWEAPWEFGLMVPAAGGDR
jgi:hypothetical protein